MDRETRLGILAAAILEGKPVDWSSVDATGDATDREVVAQLQVLSEIAALHRSHPSLGSPGTTQPAPVTPDPPAAWGHLQRLTLLGHGTYGDVYRAWDPHLEREVALKLLRTHPAPGGPGASISDPRRVVDEGRLLARVRHPHVITVFGAEPRDGVVGIWMELIHGRTLHQIVDEQGPLGAREAAGVGLDLCRALAAVHAAGLLHRDVTARNVMREDGGRIVLMDFGAGHERRTAADGAPSLAGTPLYMAPEVFSGSPADERTDIYSLGVLLFYVVTGQFPVSGRSLDQVRGAHATGTRVRLRDTRPDLPAAFVRTIERALEAAPAERFQTAGAFEAALEAALLLERPPAPVSPRWRLAMGATAAAALAGAIAWGTGGLPRGAGVSGGSGSPETAVATSVAMRQLSAMPAVSRPSNPSADGRFVAASSTTSGDAVLVDLSTGSLQPLGVDHLEASDGDGYASITVLAPDGRMVAVNWWQGNRGSLRVVRTDGTGLRALAGGDDIRDVTPYQWSHDGSMLLAAIVGQDGVATIALVATEDGAVRPLHRLSGWVNELPQQMSLSPDGRYVVYDYPENATTADRDIFVVDAHTGEQWPLVASPGHDVSPLWSPDGREIVFVSDRSRTPSAWAVAVARGRAAAPPRLVKEGLGRVRPRGFTANGSWHVDLTTGHPEVHIAQFDQPSPAPLSPRMAFGNFYPVWSHDGRMLAYASERNDRSNRELWVFDTEAGGESPVAVAEPVGRPVGWGPDGSTLLVSGANNDRLLVVQRLTGRAALVAGCSPRARWLAAGIVCEGQHQVVLLDAVSGRAVRTFDFSAPGIAGFNLAHDGRSVMARYDSARLVLHDVQSAAVRSWQDAGVTSVGRHALAPDSRAVAYMARRSTPAGDASTLMLWDGAGAPGELLRVTHEESMIFEGWTADGAAVLVTRWTPPAPDTTSPPTPRTLWRVPTNGDTPHPTALSMTGLRDVALHPDGRRLAFNAGWKEYESWAVDGLLGR